MLHTTTDPDVDMSRTNGVRDLARSAELAPGDKAVRGLLAKLRTAKMRQRETDRATFAGLFSRGHVCEERYICALYTTGCFIPNFSDGPQTVLMVTMMVMMMLMN